MSMKKRLAAVLALVMCLSLVACGGADKQPAIDAFNDAKTAYNDVAIQINENPQAFDEETIADMKEIGTLLQTHNQLLSSSEDIEEETLNEMIEWYGTVKEWVEEVKADYEIE